MKTRKALIYVGLVVLVLLAIYVIFKFIGDISSLVASNSFSEEPGFVTGFLGFDIIFGVLLYFGIKKLVDLVKQK